MKPLPIRTPTQDLTLTGCVPAPQHRLFEATVSHQTPARLRTV